jgi:hypothetical protein
MAIVAFDGYLVHQLQSLRPNLDRESGDSGDVSRWSIQAGNKTKFDRVARCGEDDRNRGGRCLGRQRRRRVGTNNQTLLPTPAAFRSGLPPSDIRPSGYALPHSLPR